MKKSRNILFILFSFCIIYITFTNYYLKKNAHIMINENISKNLSIDFNDLIKKFNINKHSNQSIDPNVYSKINLACMILTSEKTIYKKAIYAWYTWIHKCNLSIFAFKFNNFKQNITNINSNKLKFMHLNITEQYDRMAEKVLLIIRKTFELYSSNYNWFFMADEDTFVFYDNLIKFINQHNTSEPFTYGFNVNVPIKTGSHHGGAGILFTHESMKRIYNQIINGNCNYKDSKDASAGYGDRAIGYCSLKANVSVGYTLDKFKREKFHPEPFYIRYFQSETDKRNAWNFDKNQNKNGRECCSDDSVSFHRMSGNEMLLYTKYKFKDIIDLTQIIEKNIKNLRRNNLFYFF